MSNQIAKVLVPPPVAMPRGAMWASLLVAGLARFGRKAGLALEAAGRSRARRELRALDERHADLPEFPRALREAMHQAATHRDSRN